MPCWLDDFVEHTSYGTSNKRVMWWVGISVLAGALRRKVWLEEFNFQWTPNFFILLIGPPGVVKKSTSIGLGMRMLRKLDVIDFGPQNTTLAQLIVHMADSKQEYDIPGKSKFEASCVTLELSEFGAFFDPADRQMVDTLTDLWDAKIGTFRKETKTSGCDNVVNPWLNLIAGTTQGWIEDNFSSKYVRSGFASRLIYVECGEVKRVAYPSRNMPKGIMWERENQLTMRLMEISQLAGEFKLTEEAYKWGEAWYEKYQDVLAEFSEDEQGLYSRSFDHLHKLAMIISVAKGKFPVIDVEDLVEASQHLTDLGESVAKVFGRVGQSPISKLAGEILEVLGKKGKMKKGDLFMRHFFRRVGDVAFEEALQSAVKAGLVREVGQMTNPVLELI